MSVAKKKQKKSKFRQKITNKYRLVVLNEDTFQERLSFKLTILNIFVYGGVFSIILVALTTVLIAYTPIREYIPGYASTDLKRQAVSLAEVTDSLSQIISYNERYIERIRMVLKGDYAPSQIENDSLDLPFNLDTTTVALTPIREDSILRARVALEDRYNLFESNISWKLFFYFWYFFI